MPMLIFGEDQVQPGSSLHLWSFLSPPCILSPTCQALELAHLDPDMTMPSSPCHPHAITISGHLSPAPPCHPISPHSPESARHGPRRNRAPHSPENATPRRASDAHAHARARTANATGTPGRDVAPTLHATPCLRSSSAPAPSHQQPPGQAHLAAGTLWSSSPSTRPATAMPLPVKLPIATEPLPRHDHARQLRQDTSHRTRPRLAPSRPWNAGDDDDPSSAPQSPPATIKGGLLPLN